MKAGNAGKCLGSDSSAWYRQCFYEMSADTVTSKITIRCPHDEGEISDHDSRPQRAMNPLELYCTAKLWGQDDEQG